MVLVILCYILFISARIYISIYLFIYLGFYFTIVLYVCYLLWNYFMCILLYMIMCMLLSATSTHFKWELMLYCLHCSTLNKVFLLLLLLYWCFILAPFLNFQKPPWWLNINRKWRILHILFIKTSWAQLANITAWTMELYRTNVIFSSSYIGHVDIQYGGETEHFPAWSHSKRF